MNATKNLRFDDAEVEFSGEHVYVGFNPREDSQVFSVAQICNALSKILFVVGHLTLKLGADGQSSEEAERSEWHKLLRSFSNVRTLRVDDGLVEKLPCLLLSTIG